MKNQTIHSVVLPGLEAVVPQITCGELKIPDIKLFDNMPHMTLQSALWHSTPVTVKRFKGQEDSRQLLLKEADLLRLCLYLFKPCYLTKLTSCFEDFNLNIRFYLFFN